MLKRAVRGFSRGCRSCAHLVERKTELRRSSLLPRLHHVKQGPEHRATEPEKPEAALTLPRSARRAGSPPGRKPTTLAEARGPEHRPAWLRQRWDS